MTVSYKCLNPSLSMLADVAAWGATRANRRKTTPPTVAVPTMWMAFQPIVDVAGRRVFAYEALMRTRDAALPDPGAVLRDAERRNCVHEVGRQVRALTAESFAGAPRDALLFVNLHPQDLLDPSLYDARAPLAHLADRVVFEITERAAIEGVSDIAVRLAVLRNQGYRVAVDDLGSGYSALSSLVLVEPEFVKLDMSLVRDVHTSVMRQRLVRSMATVCSDMGVQIVAEGVEKAEECAALRELGCDLLQGHLFARPGPPFPRVEGPR